MRKKRNKHYLLLFIFPLFVTAAFTQTKESWLKWERKGKGFGYDHISIHKLGNGRIKYEIFQLIKTDIAGFNPQDITQKGFYIVEENMNPVSLELYIKFKTKEIHIKGNCENEVMYLTCTYDTGGILRKYISFQGVYFEVVLGNVIFRKKSEKTFKLKVFNPIELKVNDYHVEVTRSDKNGVEATVKERMTMKYQIDRKGRVQQIDFVELNSRSYLTEAENARKIDYLSTTDELSLTVRSKQSFPNLYKITQAEIQVKWKNIPFEEFKLEDNRQKLIKELNSGNEYKVILEITKPSLPSHRINLPINDERFALFLGDSDYIKPSDSSILRKLAEIKGDEHNAFMLIHKILLWTYDNVKTEYIAETLTGPEVLRKKRGKCTEYSTLFASLARAAGIPTRLAFGEAIKGNKWVGHMWCEVWLGEWIAVDAASGIFIDSPSHIKLLDSPTVMDTQKLRIKLVDNLSIEILDYKE